MNFNQLINEIRKLNPGVEIRIGDERFDREARSRIFSSVPMQQLKLPEGYYSNEKNGITNKHNAENGLYTQLSVESLDDMVVGLTMPNVDVSKNLESTDVREIAIALQKLNPGVTIKLINPSYENVLDKQIYCNVSAKELALPAPFYYDEKNGITNKHTSKTGLYTTINIEDISKVNPKLLVSTGYDLEKEKTRQYEIDIERAKESMKAAATAESYTYDFNTKVPIVDSNQILEKSTQDKSQVELPFKISEKRKFSILKRERQMNDAKRAKNKAAIMAGICILGASVAFYFNNQDLSAVISHELNAIYSWEALGQYLNDLGPLTTLLSVGAAGFISKYLKNSKKLKQAQNDFEDFNNSLENEQIKGDDYDAKTR